jgi:hypothetical protein
MGAGPWPTINTVIPLPIQGGDYLPAAPHHRAEIIHQSGPWLTVSTASGQSQTGSPISSGTVAQVYLGGTAIDNRGKKYRVDVDKPPRSRTLLPRTIKLLKKTAERIVPVQ